VIKAGRGGGGRERLTLSAVEVSDAEDVGRAALGGAVEAGAGHEGDLSLGHFDLDVGGGEGRSEGGEGGDDCGEGGLHFDGLLVELLLMVWEGC